MKYSLFQNDYFSRMQIRSRNKKSKHETLQYYNTSTITTLQFIRCRTRENKPKASKNKFHVEITKQIQGENARTKDVNFTNFEKISKKAQIL